MSYSDIKDLKYEVAVLPIGATEPHGMHLPFGQDALHSEQIAAMACERANENGAKTMLLPTIPYGVDTNQMAFPFAMNVHQSTLNTIVSDLLDTLLHHGIRKVVIVNGHGGNEFKGFLRDQFGKRDMFVCLTNWWTVASDLGAQLFENEDDHAGEMETSTALHLFPSLVHLDRASDGATRESDFEAINNGWVKITRPWHLLTKDSTSGDPRRATAEKGRRYVELTVERISDFLIKLSNTPYDSSVPYTKQVLSE